MLAALIALAAGALGVLGFGPFGFLWAGLLSPTVLVWLWWRASPRSAFILGLAWGAGLFGVGVSWVYVSLHVYGHMPPWMAVPVVIVFVAILALYPALVGWFYRRLLAGRPLVGVLLGLPALWALAEWARGWMLSGFPWLSLGYSQVDSWLGGWAPVLGVYGVSWLLLLTAALIVVAARQGGRWRGGAALLAAALWTGGWALERIDWARAAGEPLEVALVQGNVSLANKWSPEQRPAILDRYLALTNHLEDRDLVVWPESALPYRIHEVPDHIWHSMRRHPADFMLGLLEQRTDGRDSVMFNSVVAITDGDPLIYRKSHLVPFGEYLPFKPLFGWVIDYLQIPMSDFTPWRGGPQGPLRVAGTAVGVSICYEDAFPEELLKTMPAAALLVNVSEDAWFGDSLAPHQRIQMARMRARELARPMLRAANTGVSAIIDHRGRVTASSRQFTATRVKGTAQPMRGATPFVTWGNALFLALAGVLGLPALVLGVAGRRIRSREE